ncbi:MAG: hypothetical protein IKY36_05675 [Bacteroidales bacterium]|nr:hypothetical protein [Bacteroidales bacterium]
MKNIFKFFGTILTIVLTAALTGCTLEEQFESAEAGLHIKVFFPTKVVAGQPMTINGSGFADATKVVFPGEIEVTDFEIVSNDMIRVNAPAGIAAEGGKIRVCTEAEETESPLPLTLGNTVISGYSANAGDQIDGGAQITIYGKDLEFITGVELLDTDGNPDLIEDELFNRKSTGNIIFTVPKKVYEGTFVGKVYTIDGKTFEMPELTYKPASDGGYFETVEHIIWENDGSIGEAGWDNTYRFALEGTNGGDASVDVPADLWALMKNGPFQVKIQPVADWWQIRVLTGYWQGQWPAADDSGNGDVNVNWTDIVADNGDGTFTVTLDFTGHGILDLMDEQNLLFAGSGFQILKIYTSEEVWVPGGGTVEIVRTSIWKNDGSVGAASWSGSPYRFAPDFNSTGEEVYAVPAETWEKMKTTPFKVDIQPAADWFQIRILDGWWSVGNVDTNDITPNYEGLVDNGDGTFTFVLDLPSKPDLVPVLDEKHLLFAGDAFTILEMYWEEEVIVPGGGAPTEVVLWEGEAIAEDWANQPNILTDGGIELQEVGAQPGQTIYLYMEPIDPTQHWYLELVEGHWNGTTYLVVCAVGADTQGKFVEYDLEANGGRAALEITQEMLDTVCAAPQGWGGTFIANGDNLKITKVTLL